MNAEIIATYSTRQAAAAVGIRPAMLDSWLVRGLFRIAGNDIAAGGHGHPRRFSKRTIRKLAVMSRLTNLGITPTRASEISEVFLQHDQPDGVLVVSDDGAVQVRSKTEVTKLEAAFSARCGTSDSIVVIDIGRLLRKLDTALKISLGN